MNEQPTQTPAQPVIALAPEQSIWKDLLIPASIVIAGIAIGGGLYFSGGGSSAGTPGLAAVETTVERVERLAKDAGVSTRALNTCLESGDSKALVQADVDNAVETGGRGTPWSIVIGPGGQTYPINGALPAAAISQLLEIVRAEGEVPVDPNASPDINTDAVAPVTDGDWVRGDRNATITIVEYSDVDCPFCSRFHDSMKQVMAANDDVLWVYRHFPLDQLHPQARFVAEAAECVGSLEGQDAFWSFIDAYFVG